MAESKIYLEEWLVAPVLRDRLFRANPRILNWEQCNTDEQDDRYLPMIEDAVLSIGLLTPVLLDSEGKIVAGCGLVKAAICLLVDDIPALRLEDLTPEEWPIFMHSMAHYFEIVGLEKWVFRSEARQIIAMAADPSVLAVSA